MKRKEVVNDVESVLEEVERVVGEVVGKRLSLVTPATEESIKGFEVDKDMVVPSSTAKQITVDDVFSNNPLRFDQKQPSLSLWEIPLLQEELSRSPTLQRFPAVELKLDSRLRLQLRNLPDSEWRNPCRRNLWHRLTLQRLWTHSR